LKYILLGLGNSVKELTNIAVNYPCNMINLSHDLLMFWYGCLSL